MKIHRYSNVFRATVLLMMALTTQSSRGALTDVSQVPLVVSFGMPVKPNVLFIMDNSGSMAETHLPEDAWRGTNTVSHRTPQCNGLAFDEQRTYENPVDSLGAPFANADKTIAFRAGDDLVNVRNLAEVNVSAVDSGTKTFYVTNGGRNTSWYPVNALVTLYDNTDSRRWMLGKVTSWDKDSGQLKIAMDARSGSHVLVTMRVGDGYPHFVHYPYTGAQPKLSWSYSSTGAVVTSTDFYKQCNSRFDAAPGNAVFTRKIARETDANSQNFANWWFYHGNRMRMMQTVTSHAFTGIDSNFRVGYSKILTKDAKETASKNWLDVKEFDAAQRAKFYNYLFLTVPDGYTPNRAALSLAGKYFAKKATSQNYDPVEYSCQKNFSILATDGAWNDDAETASFGPFDLAGAAVGNQDGGATDVRRDFLNKANTLADVAWYYYNTDLRTSALGNCTLGNGNDGCPNNVRPVGTDDAKHQHMTTFTMSLGQNGTLKFCTGYEAGCTETDPVTGLLMTSDYPALVNGTKSWPDPFSSTSQAAKRVDDLWHAAVNGRGTFFNASDSRGVASGLKAALSTIDQVTGQGSAGATSTIEPVAGDNQFYIGSFTSGIWTGDLKAHEIDLATGSPKIRVAGNPVYIWSAAEKLASQPTRVIKYAHGGVLRDFTYTNLSGDGLAGDFDSKCTTMSQYSGLTAAQKVSCNAGSNLVESLRGGELPYFRARQSKLGDIVGSAPVFDGAKGASYDDPAYAAYLTARAGRRKMVYVGSNDGMLHAFDGGIDSNGGSEVWAFVPSAVRGNLHKLADVNYGSNHRYFVDGSIATADVKIGGSWRTVLIGGLGAGGRSYYALDITNPNNPTLLWEFTDSNLGYTHARAVISKRPSGSWVAVVPSGLNNVGDGLARLFMIDIATGAKVKDIAATSLEPGVQGTPGTPAGLGPISGWIDSRVDNISVRYYAGDNLGNLWRFDTEGLVAPNNSALLLARFKVGGAAQPVSVFPQLAKLTIGGFEGATVFVGTGRLIGMSDKADTTQQSIYAIKDKLVASGWGDIRTLIGSDLVQQAVTSTIVDGVSVRVTTKNPVAWADKAGWLVDLPDTGERINVPMAVYGNTLVAASNIPSASALAACEAAGQGSGWLYFLDMATGIGEFTHFPSSMIAGTNVMAGGVIVVPAIGDAVKKEVKFPSVGSTQTSRANWREVLDR